MNPDKRRTQIRHYGRQKWQHECEQTSRLFQEEVGAGFLPSYIRALYFENEFHFVPFPSKYGRDNSYSWDNLGKVYAFFSFFVVAGERIQVVTLTTTQTLITYNSGIPEAGSGYGCT